MDPDELKGGHILIREDVELSAGFTLESLS